MSCRFNFHTTELSGLLVIERHPINDQRGYLERMFCSEEFCAMGIDSPIAQINHTLTGPKATVRGMHFQNPPHCETKFVSCLRGKVFDVAVDLRKHSPTFLCWHAEILTEDNHLSLFIPPGFAHGFQTLSEDCEMLYLHTAPHVPSSEGAISPTEPRINISWPMLISTMSEKDAHLPPLAANYQGIAL